MYGESKRIRKNMKKKIQIGIMGCSEIAYRRFMPAIQSVEGIKATCIAEEYDKRKLKWFCEKYPLEIEDTFDALVNRNNIQSVYIPQPPAMHYEFAKKSLLLGKHVLVEKPATISYELTRELVDIARRKNLVIYENYMFQYHNQIEQIKEIIRSESIGQLRLIRADFTFPKREKNDFRYNKLLGGGALLDTAGYPVRLASILLGDSIKVDTAHLNYLDDEEVDMYGSATLSNNAGLVCQISFGMDNAYQCSLNIVGSKGKIFTNRIFTAPDNFIPRVDVVCNGEEETLVLDADSSFEKSIGEFCELIHDSAKREAKYNEMIMQARLIDQIRQWGK